MLRAGRCAWAARTVSGTVTDESGTALPGTTVLQKGTTNGQSTGAGSKFSISLPAGPATLPFSFVGFASQEALITSQTTLAVTIGAAAKGLDEVVVVGYGTQKKVNLAGAVSTISSGDIDNRAITQASQALAGRAPGMQVQQPSSPPGARMASRPKPTSATTFRPTLTASCATT